MRSPSPAERGAVTAEFAVALPAVLIVLAACLAALQLGGEQVRAVATAALVARASARGDGDRVVAAVLAADPGARLAGVAHRGDLVCARVTEPVVAVLPVVAATSCALPSLP